MTFDEIMNFYPGGNQSAFDALVEAMGKEIKPVPFVGAGLSAAFGYPGWESILNDLAKLVNNQKGREQILQQIKDKQLLEAAQGIASAISENRMLKAVKKRLPDPEKKCGEERMLNSAAFLLPRLFPDGPVMTTNFDRVLEHIYHKADKPLTPVYCDQVSLLGETRQLNRRNLVKLHGTIDECGQNKPVFTLVQYEKAYTGEVVTELKQWFQNRVLLFLGCSLDIDRTMETLRQVVEQYPSTEHYAIVSCKESELDGRIKAVGELGIDAIFYPEGKYDSVRVILEKLLETVDNAAYLALPRAEEPKSPLSVFLYDADYIPFFGREDELRQLADFCGDPGQIRWWAVTGPGGTGKSRLAYEFTRKKRQEGWNVLWIKNDLHVDALSLGTERTIVVADDAQAYLSKLGQWLKQQSVEHSCPALRLLLLERDGMDLKTASWSEVLQGSDDENTPQKDLCYDQKFLKVGRLSDDHLLNILTAYYREKTGKQLNEDYAKRLLEALKQADPDQSRPLYAMAIADAVANQNDPTKWNRSKLLDYVAGKEIDFYKQRLRGLLGDRKKKVETELVKLMVVSCIKQFLPLDEITKERWPALGKAADEESLELHDMLRQTGLVCTVHMENVETEEELEIRAVSLNCPDPVKEYLVLRQTVAQNDTALLFPDGWEDDPGYLQFDRRLLLNYPDQLSGSKSFWDRYFAGEPKKYFSKFLYGEFLWCVPDRCLEQGQRAADRLEKLMNDYDQDRFTALQYAKALVNLSYKQSLEQCRKAVGRMKLLWDRDGFRNDREFTLRYIMTLVNLTYHRPPLEENREAARLVAELWDTDDFRDDRDFIQQYIKVLGNLTAEQPLEERRETVRLVAGIWDRDGYRDDREIALFYAKTLTAQSFLNPSPEECGEIVEKIGQLRSNFQEDRDFALTYANGLVNLALAQKSASGIQPTLEQARKILHQFPDDPEFQLSCAMTWFNLTLRQEGEDLAGEITQLRQWLSQRPEADELFQKELDAYLEKHRDHADRYHPLRP